MTSRSVAPNDQPFERPKLLREDADGSKKRRGSPPSNARTAGVANGFPSSTCEACWDARSREHGAVGLQDSRFPVKDPYFVRRYARKSASVSPSPVTARTRSSAGGPEAPAGVVAP